jgi:hypothetical protein
METLIPTSTSSKKPTWIKMAEANVKPKVGTKSKATRKSGSEKTRKASQAYLSSDNELIPVEDITNQPELYQSEYHYQPETHYQSQSQSQYQSQSHYQSSSQYQYQYQYQSQSADPILATTPTPPRLKTRPLIENQDASGDDDIYNDYIPNTRIRTYQPPSLPVTVDLENHTILKTETVPSWADLEKPALYRLAEVEEAFEVCSKSLLLAKAEIVRLQAEVKLQSDNCIKTEVRKNRYKSAWNKQRLKECSVCIKQER